MNFTILDQNKLSLRLKYIRQWKSIQKSNFQLRDTNNFRRQFHWLNKQFNSLEDVLVLLRF